MALASTGACDNTQGEEFFANSHTQSNGGLEQIPGLSFRLTSRRLYSGDFTDSAVFQIGQPPARIDILQQIDGITFDEAWKNRIEEFIDGEIGMPVMARDDFIRNKLASGREQDLVDVKKLRMMGQTIPNRRIGVGIEIAPIDRTVCISFCIAGEGLAVDHQPRD